jgi:LysM repeat protein
MRGKRVVLSLWLVVLLFASQGLPALGQGGGGTYVVQPGDTLFRIALRFGTTVSALAAANGIADPNRISAGQVLVIPGGTTARDSSGSAAPSPRSVPAPVVAAGGARQIFLRGQSLGNRADVFSKVGDSITASPAFLYPVGVGGLHLNEYAYLQPVVAYFSQTMARTHNSFANTSLAADAGWTSADLLNPARALSGICQTGESPLVCEYRVTRPALALIMVGTNDAAQGIDSATYRANLQTIVQTSGSMGVIPVLSTLPDNLADPYANSRIAEFNGVIAGVAGAYGLPLWDYGRAMQDLPNRGLSPDGVHPSNPADGETGVFTAENLKNGYTLRNLTALMILNEVWQSTLY